MGMTFNSTLTLSSSFKITTAVPLDIRCSVDNASDLTYKWTDENEVTHYNYKDIFKVGAASTWYQGMIVYAKDTKKLYILKGLNRFDSYHNEICEFEELKTDSNISLEDIEAVLNNKDFITGTTLSTTLNNYVTQSSLTSQLTGLYRIKGVVNDVDKLPALTEPSLLVGDVYNIRNKFSLETKLDDGTTTLITYPPGTNVVCVSTTIGDVQVKRWDALGGTHEFDWIDIEAEPEEPTPDPDPTPDPEPTEPTA